jgi:ATPase subunit of ABC transporter with duplicated ATPase domains
VFATVADGLGDVAQLLVDYHAAMLAVADDASEAALARLEDLQHRVEDAQAWRLEQRVEQVLGELGCRARRWSAACRAAASSGWRWPGRWWASRRCCSSTSRPTTWTSTASCGSKA